MKTEEDKLIRKVLWYELFGREMIEETTRKKRNRIPKLYNRPSVSLMRKWQTMAPIKIERKKILVEFN